MNPARGASSTGPPGKSSTRGYGCGSTRRGWATGERVLILIRPEALELQAAGNGAVPGANALTAEVLSQTFLGPVTRLKMTGGLIADMSTAALRRCRSERASSRRSRGRPSAAQPGRRRSAAGPRRSDLGSERVVRLSGRRPLRGLRASARPLARDPFARMRRALVRAPLMLDGGAAPVARRPRGRDTRRRAPRDHCSPRPLDRLVASRRASRLRPPCEQLRADATPDDL